MNIELVVNRFKFLDLTEYQSRVLYALLKNKSCSIADISKISGVPNTRVYDVVKQLISMDYVLQISDKPKLYRVRNVDTVVDSLVHKKEEQFKQLRTELNDLKEFFKDDNSETNSKLVKVDKEIDLIKILNEELGNATKSIIGFGYKELENSAIRRTLSKAVSNNVDVRLIAHPNQVDVQELYDAGTIKPYEHGLSAYLIDDKKLVVKLSKHNDEIHHMSVMNDHEDMKAMVKSYFNTCWNSK